MRPTAEQILLIVVAVISIVIIACSDRLPDSVQADAETDHPAMEIGELKSDDDKQIDKALAIIDGGGAPMEGILLLKELAEREGDPNLDAIFLLGKLSVQSGQLDKAVERFNQVLEIVPNHLDATWELAMLNMKMGDLEAAILQFDYCVKYDLAYANGYFFIGQCYEAMEQTEPALEAYKAYLPLTPDSIVSVSVEGIINRLEVGATVANDPNS